MLDPKCQWGTLQPWPFWTCIFTSARVKMMIKNVASPNSDNFFFPLFKKLVSGGEIAKMLNDVLHSSQKEHIPAVGSVNGLIFLQN